MKHLEGKALHTFKIRVALVSGASPLQVSVGAPFLRFQMLQENKYIEAAKIILDLVEMQFHYPF